MQWILACPTIASTLNSHSYTPHPVSTATAYLDSNRPPRDEHQALADKAGPALPLLQSGPAFVGCRGQSSSKRPCADPPQAPAQSRLGPATHLPRESLEQLYRVGSFLLRSYCTSSAISALLAACGCIFPSQDRPAGQGDGQHVRQHTCGKRLGRIDAARCPWRRCPRCSLTIPKSSNEDQSLYPRRKIRISCAFRSICGKGSFGG